MKQMDTKGSLTVEAALLMPIFLYAMMAFLYFIHIFVLQDKLQSAITEMGLSLARHAYVYSIYLEGDIWENADASLQLDELLVDLAKDQGEEVLLKAYLSNFLEEDEVNNFCIQDGFRGIDLSYSTWLDEEDCIDIVLSYQVELPLPLIFNKRIPFTQRVRLRGWTGHQVPAQYGEQEEQGDEFVYITATGTVYHTNSNCSHIKITANPVLGIPSHLRNDNGGKYYPCESCCKSVTSESMTFYITSDGTRYHTTKTCSKIKRTIQTVKRSEVSERRLCKKCEGS